MADEPDSPAALNRDLRAWVKNWTGMGIGQVASGSNISHSRAYAATANANLVPRDLLLAIIRAAVPTTYATDERTAWILRWTREWERRWEVVEAATRGEQPRQRPAEPVGDRPPVRPNPVVRLDPNVALPAFGIVTDDAVRRIVAGHVYVAEEPSPVGYHEQVAISVYIDMHSASCYSRNREDLAQFLAGRLRSTLGGLDPSRTVIATPREGNILVGSRVAELCGVPFLMVRTTRPPRFGFPVEGTYGEGTEAVIVDDIVMGSLIPRTVGLLRTHAGISTRHCISIFERSDVDVGGLLTEEGVLLDAAFKLDDTILTTLHRLFDKHTRSQALAISGRED